MERIEENLVTLALLDYPALIHDDDVILDEAHNIEVVGDKEHGYT